MFRLRYFFSKKIQLDILFDVSRAENGYIREIQRDSDSRYIVFEDSQDIMNSQDYSICKSRNGVNIRISEYSYNSDFKIYHDSSIFTLKEAIAILVTSNYKNFLKEQIVN